MANTYIIKVASSRKLNDIVAHVEQVGRVIAFNLVINETTRLAKSPTFTPESKAASNEAKREVAVARALTHKEEVHKDLGRILQNNQHAPLETIVKLLNGTAARTQKGKPFNNETIKSYLDFSLEKLTAVRPPNNTRPISTPPEIFRMLNK